MNDESHVSVWCGGELPKYCVTNTLLKRKEDVTAKTRPSVRRGSWWLITDVAVNHRNVVMTVWSFQKHPLHSGDVDTTCCFVCIVLHAWCLWSTNRHCRHAAGGVVEVFNLFPFTHRRLRAKLYSFLFPPRRDETPLRPRLLYISCTITDCWLILMCFYFV